MSAALSAAFVGQWADRFGRRRACLVYCAAYTLCCLSILSDDLAVLLLGKILGGASTTLLYSTFDAWMITEYRHRDLGAKGLSLATLYGWLTSLNSVVAIATGVLGELLVSAAGTKVAPFMFASLVFLSAASWMSMTWVRPHSVASSSVTPVDFIDHQQTENFGSKKPGGLDDSFATAFTSSVRAMWQGLYMHPRNKYLPMHGAHRHIR